MSVSSNIIKTLLDRDWIRIVGHRDVPGKPALYGTTKAFLDYFDLRSLDRLPPLSELRDLAKINEELGFETGEAGEDGAGSADAVDGGTAGADVVPLRAVLGQFEPPRDDADEETVGDASAAAASDDADAYAEGDAEGGSSGDAPGAVDEDAGAGEADAARAAARDGEDGQDDQDDQDDRGSRPA